MQARAVSLSSFFEHVSQAQSSFLSLYVFVGEQYPSLFVARVLALLKHHYVLAAHQLDITARTDAEIKSMLSMSFLGQRSSFYVGNLSVLSSKERLYWRSYLEQYEGPHTVICFDTACLDIQRTDAMHVQLPTHISRTDFKQIGSLFGCKGVLFDRFADALYERCAEVGLDTAAILFEYAQLVGKGTDQFFDEWLFNIVSLETSLFRLSQHFFAKDARLFFAQWEQVKNHYPAQFFVSYWSEQLWTGHLFTLLAKEGKITEARKIGYRLPFSFIQRQWHRYQHGELKKAHDALIALDSGIKLGAPDAVIDLFYSSFFQNM